MALEPGAGIGQHGKAVGMAFGKAVFTEALDLADDGVGEFRAVALGQHAHDQLALEMVYATLAPPGGHGAAQFVGLARREVRCDHGDLHDLLLEDGHAQRALQRLLEFRLLQHKFPFLVPALARLQIGMHHAALYGPRPHDGDLDHQVVELARPQPGQHAHLGAAFDLEGAHGVGAADHVVGGGVILGNVGQFPARPAQRSPCLQAAAQHGEHAQGQHIDLEQIHGVQIVLVPLDDRAAFHGRRLHGHQPRQRPVGQHEAAHVLAQVARAVAQLQGQLQPQPRTLGRQLRAVVAQPLAQPGQAQQLGAHPAQGRVIGFGLRLGRLVLGIAEPVVLPGHGVDQHRIHAQGLARVAQCAARAPAADHSRQGGTVTAVFFVDVLDDGLAPRVLEVHVDIGRLAALAADEARDQQRLQGRIDGRDAQAEADHRVRGRTAPLAQDSFAARKAHDVVHGEKVHLVAAVGDQRQFFFELVADRVGNALRIAPRRSLPGMPGQGLARVHAGQHAFLRIAVADLVELEIAARGNLQGCIQHGARIDATQPKPRAQMPLGIGVQLEAALGHRAAQAQRRHQVLQRLARARMHVHVATGHAGQAQ